MAKKKLKIQFFGGSVVHDKNRYKWSLTAYDNRKQQFALEIFEILHTKHKQEEIKTRIIDIEVEHLRPVKKAKEATSAYNKRVTEFNALTAEKKKEYKDPVEKFLTIEKKEEKIPIITEITREELKEIHQTEFYFKPYYRQCADHVLNFIRINK